MGILTLVSGCELSEYVIRCHSDSRSTMHWNEYHTYIKRNISKKNEPRVHHSFSQ